MKVRYVRTLFSCGKDDFEAAKGKAMGEHMEKLQRDGCREIKTRTTKRVYGDYEIVSLCSIGEGCSPG
ncbi:MAG: hypothetical protein AABX40_02120 [Candidatus Hydrothermarchaeota archaeon]